MNIPQEFEDVFRGVELTEDEIRTLTWITGWERRTVKDLRSAIQKAQATALSTLQAENSRLRADLEYEREHADAYYEECGQWEVENEKLRTELENYRKGHCSEGGCAAEKDRDAVLAELERVKADRDAAIEYLREIEWCAGCKYFGGLDGCKKWATGQCTEKHDLYEFIGPQKGG